MRTTLVWLALLLIISACNSQQTTSEALPPLPVMTPEPIYNFTMETLDGKTVSLEDFEGQWVLVNFWATWCHPCVKEMPYLQSIADEGDMVVLGVNYNESSGAVKSFVEEHNITFPILMNPSDVVITMYQARSLPRTFVIAPNGTIVQRIIGEIDPEQFNTWREQHVKPLAQN